MTDKVLSASRKSKIQSVLISRQYYTKPKAIEWIINHNFKYYKLDVTQHYYRFRQFTPLEYKSHRVILLKPGIEAIIEY